VGHNLGVYAYQKKFQANSTKADYTCFTKVYKPSNIAMTKHLGSQDFCGSYVFHCHIGLKLFLRLARATGEGSTKFGIFLG
jgi:hypothetical protein